MGMGNEAMADEVHLYILKQGIEIWNMWRKENSTVKPNLIGANLYRSKLSGNSPEFEDLMSIISTADDTYLPTIVTDTAVPEGSDNSDPSSADLSGADLSCANLNEADLRRVNLMGANLNYADLSGADLSYATLYGVCFNHANLSNANLRETNLIRATFDSAQLNNADLSNAQLREANLSFANLKGARLRGASLINADLGCTDLCNADLREADLSGADLGGAKLNYADLSEADLGGTQLVNADLSYATLVDCSIFGVSVWNLKLDRALQRNLMIRNLDESTITVDNIEVAQFIYLLLRNEKVRDVIDTITAKAVLILGRFSEERKIVLDAIREELRNLNFLPILFDFPPPISKDVTGTVETLARMSRFIIADLTDPSSIPHELATIVPFLRTTPVLPLRLIGAGGYSMFDDLQRAYPWVLKTHEYKDSQSLISTLPQVIAPADKMANRLRNLVIED